MKLFIIIMILLIITIIILIVIRHNVETYKQMNEDLYFVDNIIFINLDNRKDRLEHMKKMLYFIDPNKIHRLDAIKDNNGVIGCSKSHIRCLEIAIKNNWKNVLILEDDFIWNNYQESVKIFENIYHTYPHFDVITLGNTFAKFDKKTYKLYDGSSTVAYLVNRHYYKKLKDNYEKGLINLLNLQSPEKNAVDRIWKILIQKDNWYIVNPSLCRQISDYSSIEKKYVNYDDFFNR